MKYIFYNDFETRPEQAIKLRWSGANGFCFDDNQNVCIVWEHAKGEWNLPGGGKEGRETPEETFKREVLEETQCELTDIQYFHSVYVKCFDMNEEEVPVNANNIGFRFICKLRNIKEFIPRKDGSEIDERKFVTLEDLPNYISWLKDTENGRESLEKLKEIINAKL